MAVERCVVSFAGQGGITHNVAVDAHSVFEAAAQALSRVGQHAWLKSELTLTTIVCVQLVDRQNVYRVQVRRLLAWFDAAGPDRARRFQLKRLVAGAQDSPRGNMRLRTH